MVNSVSTAPALQAPAKIGGNTQSNGGNNKMKLDIETTPKSNVRIQPTGSAGFGKGLKIDISA